MQKCHLSVGFPLAGRQTQKGCSSGQPSGGVVTVWMLGSVKGRSFLADGAPRRPGAHIFGRSPSINLPIAGNAWIGVREQCLHIRCAPMPLRSRDLQTNTFRDYTAFSSEDAISRMARAQSRRILQRTIASQLRPQAQAADWPPRQCFHHSSCSCLPRQAL